MMHQIAQRRAARVSITACVALVSCSDNLLVGVPAVSRVVLDVDPPVIAVGGTSTLRAWAYRSNGDVITHTRRTPSFLSRDTSVATVRGAGTGELRGAAPGAAVIVAESGGQRDSVVVLVTR